jgi:hypothetical protein
VSTELPHHGDVYDATEFTKMSGTRLGQMFDRVRVIMIHMKLS